ncbi:la-related protein 1C [Dorcoceras hygrometricum]|uniref:La-related protein 1C n=1 Tax=Dorcoceras hygrometricum TaxID=472368 RepID=A0A2Z7CGG8_9LAMI|nr:la-related protein 1C [Dorcoceras hygrometricum]
MSTASNSHAPAPVHQSLNSSHSRHSRKESLERGVPPLADSFSPSSFSGISDQKQVMASDFHPYEVITPPVSTASFLADDDQTEGSDNGGVTKKHVWNKSANGVGAVMGADSWPALSKSTESLKELSLGSLSLSKVVDLGQNNATANGSFSQAPNTHSHVVEESSLNPVKSSGSAGSPMNNAHRDVGQRGGSYGGRESHQPRAPFRRNNSGPQLQGNGSFNQSHGGSKRDQERGKRDWSSTNRSFGSRVNLAPQQWVASRPFIHGPISNSPFISPPTAPVAVRPYGPPVFYNDLSPLMYYPPGSHPGSLGQMPMVPFAPMFYPMPDPNLPSKIVSQIDYYFSDENLVKDTFLRQKMDVDGWVPINLIANFKKIRELTDNVQLILDALQASNVVEIQGENLRKKGNWKKWVLPSIMYPTGLSPLSRNNSSVDIPDEKTAT